LLLSFDLLARPERAAKARAVPRMVELS